MDISVLLATWYRADILYRTLESFCSLDAKGLKWEVLVVDNANDKETQKVIDNYRNKLPIKYLLETKKGKSNALNKGVEVAKGGLFVFTDDDVIADSNWLVEMWEGAKRWPNYSVFGGRILPIFPKGKIPISKEHPFFKGAYVVADWDINEGPYQAEKVWGPNMCVRSSIFHQGWRFNPNLGPNGTEYIMGDETELTTKLEKDGIGAIYLPKSLVYHQIRPEQMDIKWVYRRAFMNGRTRAWNGDWPNVPRLFGIPRYLVREAIEASMKRILYFTDNAKSVEFGIEYWITRGMVYQYRKGI